MDAGVSIRLDIVGHSGHGWDGFGEAEHEFRFGLIDSNAGPGGFDQHPLECDFGKPALLLFVTSAHVGMHTREPHLANILAGAGRAPEIIAVIAAALIDRHRVASRFDDGIVSFEGKLWCW